MVRPSVNKPRAEISALRDHTGFWLRTVSNDVSQAFSNRLSSSGVTVAEWVILREMYGQNHITSPGVIAELTGLTKGAVSKLIDRLLRKRLVSRSEDRTDRRYQNIELTAQALALVPKLASLADENDEEFFSVLSKTERKQLIEILKKIVRLKKISHVPVE